MSESAGVTAVRCDVCGYEYPNPTQAAAEPPGTPCPNTECGSTTGRHVYIEVSDSIGVYDLVKYNAKRSGEKPHIKIKAGAELRVSKGDYVDTFRRIDRGNDDYEEIVTDRETGEVIHSDRGPLSQHTDHGSAKFKNS